MLNKVTLIGRLGRDPEVRYLPNGEATCTFSLATSETWNDRNSGQRQERTEWHNIVMYRRLAEIAGQYLKKGSQAYIEGRIQSRKYTGKDGIERTAYEIIASEMKMLDGKSSGSQSHYSPPEADDHDFDQHEPAARSAPVAKAAPPAPPRKKTTTAAPSSTATSKPTASSKKPAVPMDDIEGDIPF